MSPLWRMLCIRGKKNGEMVLALGLFGNHSLRFSMNTILLLDLCVLNGFCHYENLILKVRDQDLHRVV